MGKYIEDRVPTRRRGILNENKDVTENLGKLKFILRIHVLEINSIFFFTHESTGI